MLTGEERARLRLRALGLWSDAKRLVSLSECLPPGVGDGPAVPRGSNGSAVDPAIQRVDWVLDESAEESVNPEGQGVGLVVASQVRVVATLHDALHEWLPRVWTARDPALGLGLAIREQPDVAVVDDHLPVMAGLDAAVLIRLYAPSTRVVLLTGDPPARLSAYLEGILSADRGSTPVDLLRPTVTGSPTG